MRERANCAQHSTLKGTTLDKKCRTKGASKAHGSGRKILAPLLRLLILKMRYGKSQKTKIIGLNWEA